ncbi:MAG: RES family NAD+ phosphorylase [Vibrio sp.]|uniref:RES family NAD+ phosphorylase n=1 Tax=Vibrio sp. TaxID=678 RepID=UPI003A8A242D
MKLYRLTKKKYADDPFSSIGARTYGGRWNSKGTEAVYFASSESLACLEILVHISHDPELIDKYDLYCIDLPSTLTMDLATESLPKDWRQIPESKSTQLIGDEFIREMTDFAALAVPSVISPRDINYLVNPAHEAMREIFESANKLDFQFDPRIFKLSSRHHE